MKKILFIMVLVLVQMVGFAKTPTILPLKAKVNKSGTFAKRFQNTKHGSSKEASIDTNNSFWQTTKATAYLYFKNQYTLVATNPPTALATQVYAGTATLADLTVTGTAIKWYAAATGGTALATSTVLVNGTTYYASQTIASVESTRIAITVNKISEATQTLSCTSTTVSSLVSTPSNGTISQWFTASTGGTLLATATALTSGTYYVNQITTPMVSRFAGGGSFMFTDGTYISAQFKSPLGIAMDSSGILYVADQLNNRIRKVTSTGDVSTIAGNSTSGYANGTGAAAQFGSPLGIGTDLSGNIYVSDQLYSNIRKITPSGVVTTFAGNNGPGYTGFADGTGTAAKFDNPHGIAIDASGNVYVADSNNHRIRKITQAGVVTTFAGNGNAGFADGTSIVAQFNNPKGLAFDSSGNLYVGDANNNRIRKITPAGVVTTLAGSGTAGFSDGIGTSAQFNTPYGVSTDASGNVYVADYLNHKIRKISSTGLVSTLAGGIIGYANGVASSAQFSRPISVATDASGNVYVGDNNNMIRKITQGEVIESNRVAVNITVNNTPIPTASAQSFCGFGKVSQLVATGTAIKWYSASTGGFALSSNDYIFNAGTYYVTQTLNTCESVRTPVSISINSPVTPTFNQVPDVCAGATLSALPTTSLENILGTWSPALDSTTTTDYYFQPDSGQCAMDTAMTITVLPSVTPTFTQVAPIFSGASLAALPITSNNGVTGTWSPALNNTSTTTYTFTPNAGQCGTTANMTITVNANSTPTFTQVSPICSGANLAALPTLSNNNFTGTWSPALNNLATTTYTFTPTAGQNATTASMTIVVNPNTTPTFNAIAPICSGATLSALPTTSTNSITGTWSPALNNSATTTYTFTPSSGQCALNTTLTITVNTTAAPSASNQSFCAGNTVAGLVATGTSLKWYSVATNGTTLTSSTAIATGTYYVSQTLNSCEGARTSVSVTVNTTPAPTASAQTFCSGAKVSDLVATGTSLQWYTASTGGSALTTTTALVSGTYYVSQTLNSCESARTSVSVTVNTTPPAPTASAQTFCSGATVANLVATPGLSARLVPAPYKWYTVSTGGTALATSTALVTGTYYVSSKVGSCEGPRTAVSVTLNTTAAPTASNQSLCPGSTVAGLVATGTNIKWYNAASGGASLAGTTTLVAGNYFASQTLNGCESLTRKAITVSLGGTSLGTISAISGKSNVCGITTTTYSVTPLAGATNYIWSFPTGISPTSSAGNQVTVAIDSSFESGVITVKANNSCGNSANTPRISVSKIVEIAAIVGSPTNCGLSTATYSVENVVGATFNWTTPQGISIVSGQGTSSVTISFDNTFISGTPISVQATNNCGVSAPRRLVIYSAQKPITVNGPQHVCNRTTATYTTPAIIGTTFNWTTPANMSIISGQGTNAISVSISNSFDQGDLLITATSNCGTSDPYVFPISKTKAPSAISGPKSICGIVENNYNSSGTLVSSNAAQAIYSVSNVLGATNYTWTVPTGATIVSGQGTNSVVLSFDIANFVNGLISVTADTACGTSLPTTLSISRTLNKISGVTNVCSISNTTYSVSNTIGSNFIWSVPSWMTITSGQNSNSIDVSILNPACREKLTLNYTSACGTSETIFINVGCNELTKVVSNLCGTTLPSVNTIISADNLVYSSETYIQGITKYKFRVTDGTSTNYYESTNGKFKISNLSSWNYGTTYTIDIALQINGVYKDYGCACSVTTPSFSVSDLPTTKISNAFCGSTITYLNTKIAADFIADATNYRFEITSNGQTKIYDSATYNFRLTDVAGIATYDTQYSIRVAVLINGVYSNYGVACIVSTPVLSAASIPQIKINVPFCGATLASNSTKIPAEVLTTASGYRFEVTAAGTTVVYDSPVYNFMLSQTGITVAAGTIYSIRVAALVNGVYGNYGASCTVTTPASGGAAKTIASNDNEFTAVAYPNPFDNTFALKVNGNQEAINISVYDQMGRLVETKEVNASEVENLSIGQNYANGIYNVLVAQGTNSKAIRLVRK